MIFVCNVIIKSLILRFYVKIRILHSGLMEARLSVQHLHIIFLKIK